MPRIRYYELNGLKLYLDKMLKILNKYDNDTTTIKYLDLISYGALLKKSGVIIRKVAKNGTDTTKN